MARGSRRGLDPSVKDVLLERDGARCYSCARPADPGDLEVEHVQEAADNGSDDLGNLGLIHSGGCHQRKTTAVARERRRWREELAGDGTHAPLGWLRYAAGGGPVLAAVGWLFAVEHLRWWLALYVVAVLAGVVLMERDHHRRRVEQGLSARMSARTKSNPVADRTRVRGWDVWASPRRIVVPLGGLFDWSDEAARLALHDEARLALGPCDMSPNLRRRLVTFTAVEWETVDAPPTPTRPAVTQRDVSARVREEVEARLKGATVRFRGVGDDGRPEVVTVAYPAGWTPAKGLADLQDAVQAMTDPVRYRVDVRRPTREVVLTRRPELPFPIDRPTDPVLAWPDAPEDVWRWLPHGVDENGRETGWRVDDRTPHCLVVGETGGGKSVDLRGKSVEAARRGWLLVLVDGKGTTLAGLAERLGPNVVIASGMADPERTNSALVRAEALMVERYTGIAAGTLKHRDLRPVLVVVDEMRTLKNRLERWWAQTRGKTDPRTPPGWQAWQEIARLGREAEVHLVIGAQQGNADVLEDTEQREQFGAAFAYGALEPEGAKMVFGNVNVGRDLPNVAGRCTVDLKDGPFEAQAYWTPKVLPGGEFENPEDRRILDPLLPPPAVLTVEPEPESEPVRRPQPAPVLEEVAATRLEDLQDAGRLPVRVDLGEGPRTVVRVERLDDDNLELDVAEEGLVQVSDAHPVALVGDRAA